MKNPFLLAALCAVCFTGCATNYSVLTQAEVHQIHPGDTTEAEAVALFGPPDTRWEATYGMKTQLDWFRSVPPGPASYLPIVGPLFGGLDLDVQQLTLVFGPNGRVESYRIYDSDGAVQSEKTRIRSGISNSAK